MKKIFLHLIAAILCICLLNACKKGFNDQQSVPITEHPDLVSTIRMSVSGFVTDENGGAANGAAVIAGTKSTITDAYGYFKITDVSLSKTAGFIKISKAGYFDGFRTFVGIENQESFTRIQLVPKTSVGTITAAVGGTVNTTDGATVTLPANAVVVASNNAAYSGNVHVAAHLFKQDDITQSSKAMPGDNRGTDSDGYLKILHSYGMLAVELTGDAGQLLQIAAGKEATITTPIPSASAASAPASIALWSFDGTKGLWKQESTATKNGNNYTGNVQHFSFWDGATGVPLVNLTVQIVNTSLQAMGNVFVVVRKANDPTSAAAAYTNNQGFVSGAVLANTALILEVYNTCGSPVQVLSQNFTTNTANVDLGTITANLGQQLTITGTVVNCNNMPVANGYVLLSTMITSSSNTNFRIPITNGSFNFSTVACPNMNASYVAIDEGAHQQGYPQTITLVPGANNLGALTACGTSSISEINYRVDGGPWINLTEPGDTMLGVYSYNGGLNTGGTIMTVNAGNFNPQMQFQYYGLDVLGSNHTVSDIWSNSFLAPAYRCEPVGTMVLTITEFGAMGSFIAGNFSGPVTDWTDQSPHTLECNFRVRRAN